MKVKYVLPEEAWQTINEYKYLPLGGKKVTSPYYINLSKERGGLRVLVGKGTPEEILHEVKVWGKLKGFELENASQHQIREFMIQRKIGIECSGFLYHVITRWLQAKHKGNLVSKLKFHNNGFVNRFRRWLRPAENVSANTMTSDLNTEKIKNLNDIRPGDLIRAKGRVKNAHHVAMISEVKGVLDEKNKFTIESFKYIHSHRFYEDQNGIREGEVIVTNPKGDLKDQNWLEVYKGKNWMLDDLLKDYHDNGIRRPHYLAKLIAQLTYEQV